MLYVKGVACSDESTAMQLHSAQHYSVFIVKLIVLVLQPWLLLL